MCKRLFLSLAVLAILFGCCSCTEGRPVMASQALDFTQESEEARVLPDFLENSQGVQTYAVSEEYRINQANVYAPDESLSQYGLFIEKLYVRKSKTLPEDVKLENFQYFQFGDTVDAEGRLLEKTSYLFLDMTVRNDNETPLTLSWNSVDVFATDADGYVANDIMLTPWEARYRSGREREEYAKDYFMQTLEPGESVAVTIGFVIDDSYIDSDRLYAAPTKGLSADSYNKTKLYQINSSAASKEDMQ